MSSLQEALAERVIVCDGAMGTVLDVGYGKFGMCKEKLNLSDAQLIKSLHRSYIEAGAQLIHTNSFGANRIKLSEYALSENVRAINVAAARLACEVAGPERWVAGSVGPLGMQVTDEALSNDEVIAAFTEQIEGLAEGGVSLISLETFLDLKEMLLAIKAAKAVTGTPPICQFRGFTGGKLGNESDTETVLRSLRKQGVTILGANCHSPYLIKEALDLIAESGWFDLIAQPNAGPPEEMQGRVRFRATPEYVAEYSVEYAGLGARLIGGCCGTSPEHIQVVSEALSAVVPAARSLGKKRKRGAKVTSAAREHTPAILERPTNPFVDSLGKQFAVTVELRPPKGADCSAFIDAAGELREAGAKAVNVTDNSLGNLTMSSLVLAGSVQAQAGLQAIMHYTCRHRNLLSMQSDLLGASALGVDTVLALSGDHPSAGDTPDAIAVHNISSIGLIGLITNYLNQGVDRNGNRLSAATRLAVGCAYNPNVNVKVQTDYLRKKIAAGARFCLTQPIYDPEIVRTMRSETKDLSIPILPGILPVRSFRNAKYLRDNVAGLHLPDALMQRLSEARTVDQERRIGLELAQQMFEEIQAHSPGVYLIAPFGNHKIICDLLRG